MTARPSASASATGLPSSDSRKNGAGVWSPSGVTWNAESSSSSESSAAAAGSSPSPSSSTAASASLRLDVRVARLLELHYPHDAARHRRRALDQVLEVDLLPRHRDLAGVEPEPAGQQGLELAAHVGIDVPGEKRAQRRAVNDELERLDVLPADDVDVIVDVDEHGLGAVNAGIVQVIDNLVPLRLRGQERRVGRARPRERSDGDHRDEPETRSHRQSPLRPTTRTRARGASFTRPRPL